MNKLLISVVFFIVILGNFAAYYIRSVLKNNNYPVNHFPSYFKDIKDFFHLAKSTKDKDKRTKYFFLSFVNIGIGIAFVSFTIFLISTLPSLNESSCNAFKDFKTKKYDFVVINKYVDKTEHSYSTLLTKDKLGRESKNIDLVFDTSQLFNYLKIGDSVSKQNGSNIVKVINGKTDTTFKVDFGCEEK